MPRSRKPHAGASPGTLVIDESLPDPTIRVFRYSKQELEERKIGSVDELAAVHESTLNCWVVIEGLGDEKILRRVAEIFAIHPLALEDIVNVPSRPKTEQYDGQQIFISRSLEMTNSGQLRMEQESLVLGKHFVITFSQRTAATYERVMERLRAGTGAMRTSGSDYLAYAVLDAIVDGYYPALEKIGARLDDLEDEVMLSPSPRCLQDLSDVRNTLLHLRRTAWPQRDAVNSLVRGDSPLVGKPVRIYLRDVYDHCTVFVETCDSYREMVNGIMNIYLSVVSNRMNEIMKVLTIMGSIFIPLTFVAGIYGMNFEYLPETKLKWGYAAFWAVALLMAGGMLWFFKRRGWLGGRDAGDDRPGGA